MVLYLQTVAAFPQLALRAPCHARFQGQAHATVEAARVASAARPELAAIHAKAVQAAGERYAAEKASRG